MHIEKKSDVDLFALLVQFTAAVAPAVVGDALRRDHVSGGHGDIGAVEAQEIAGKVSNLAWALVQRHLHEVHAHTRSTNIAPQQGRLMVYDPATGWSGPCVEPTDPQAWREKHGTMAWLFNPWTGERRDARDVGSDPFGLAIVPPGEPLKAG